MVFRHADDLHLFYHPDILATPEMNGQFGTRFTRSPAAADYPETAADITKYYTSSKDSTRSVKEYLEMYRGVFGFVTIF